MRRIVRPGSWLLLLCPVSYAGTDDRALEEFVVTAQRRPERLLDVPLAVTVLDGTRLDASSLTTTDAALATVPGVSPMPGYQGGTTLLAIRGVGASASLFNGSSPIAYFLDSAAFGFVNSAITPDLASYDLSRIEVLRGPQGSLYGASAENGVVRVLTRDPDLRAREVTARLRVSSTEDGGAGSGGDLAVNLPLVDERVALRAVGSYANERGWIDGPVGEDVNDERRRSWRLKVAALPHEAWRAQVSAWQDSLEMGAPSASDDDGNISATAGQPIDSSTAIYAVDLEHGVPKVVLTSHTSYLEYRNDSLWDPTAAGVPGLLIRTQLRTTVLAQELGARSEATGPWRWTAGLYWRRADDDLLQTFAWLPAPIDYSRGSESWAAYGELTRQSPSGRFEWTLGIRRFTDRVHNQENRSAVGDPAAPLYREEEPFDATTPRIVLGWRPRDDLSVYGSYAEGTRSGYPQDAAIANSAPGFPAVRPDRLRNFEVGFRSRASERLSFEGAAYYMRWNDVQQALSVWLNGVPQTAGMNAGSASGPGVDFAAALHPIAGLDLTTALSWNGLTLDEAVFVPQGRLFERGDRLNYSPEFSGSLSAEHERPLGGSGYSMSLSLSATYTSAQSYRGSNLGLSVNEGDALTMVRAAATLVAPAHWSVTAFVDNATNDYGATPTINSPDEWQLRPRPRSVGLSFAFEL